MCGTRCKTCRTKKDYPSGCYFTGYGDSGACSYEDDEECINCQSSRTIAEKMKGIKNNIFVPCENCNDPTSLMMMEKRNDTLTLTCGSCGNVSEYNKTR